MRSDPRAVLSQIRREMESRRAEEARRNLEQRQAEAARTRDERLFRATVGDVVPLPPGCRSAMPVPAPRPPVPRQRMADEAEALAESLSDGIDADTLLETDEALSFARPGVGAQTLKRLRRGEWVVQAHLDLHGLTRDAARDAVADLLRSARQQGLRCVRIVHGKGLGSVNRTPVLKNLVRRWLSQSATVMAYTQARAPDGGAGALIVLLAAPNAPAAGQTPTIR